jgi:hypothetical protein
VNSYDAKYASCWEMEKSRQPGYQLYFPSPEYDHAARTCEQVANR